MSELVLCCGKVCSGKSTFTKILEAQYKYYIFSADEWMLKLYKETTDRAVFDDNFLRCTHLIYELSERILLNNSSNKVALDFGFWNRENRESIINRFSNQGISVSLIYFPITIEQQLLYMNIRQNNKTEQHYHFDKSTIEQLNNYFEEPEQSEMCISKDDYLDKLRNVKFS